MQHQQYLKKLLIYDKDTTIVDVIGKMRSLLLFFESNHRYRTFIPFLQVYLRVTELVLQSYWENEKFYSDYQHTDSFDVRFAELYFIPMREYLLFGSKSEPWKTYFDYCERGDGIPFVQILLGINAHINADLLTTLLELPYTYKDDYFIINDILLKTIPGMMLDLLKYHKDLYSVGGLLFKPVTKYEFEQTVVKWRNNAWDNSFLIKTLYPTSFKPIYHKQTERLGERIIQIFEKLENFDHIFLDVEELNSLKIALPILNLRDFK